MAKLISELEVGDKVFIIHKDDWIFDVAEIIEDCLSFFKIVFYFKGTHAYLWKCDDPIRKTFNYIVFIDESKALNVFKSKLNGRNR